MPFTIPEALADLPELLVIVQKIASGAQALPKPLSASAVTDLAASVLPDLGRLIDKVAAQAAD